LPDKLTGVTSAQAITAALLARERTGEGQHVRLSMLDSIIAFLWSSDMGGQTFVDKKVSPQRAASFIDLIYQTSDGYMSVSVMTDAQWKAACHIFGHAEWLEDDRFATTALRDINIDARLGLIQSVLETDSTDHWMAKLEAAGVPCAPVLHRAELLDHPQVKASAIIQENHHPKAGRLRQTRNAARFSVTEAEFRHGAPDLGEHTDEILAEAGFSTAEIETLRSAGVSGSD
jgi:crotonobetainyl-CoA:carnitine CoA-transferase CaiB-like acyl-CoA transferase